MFKKITKILISLSMIFALALSVSTDISATSSGTYEFEYTELEEAIVKSLLATYISDQSSTETIDTLISELKAINSDMGETWEDIMDFWESAINGTINRYNPDEDSDPSDTYEQVVSTDLSTIPDYDIEDDSTLCIVILGYELNSDGSMQNELYGRILTGYALYKQYPDAVIAVTDGGTAKNNSSVTEGSAMADYLINTLGVDKDKVIVEDSATNTAGNAINTMKILNESYTNIENLIIVTSDYHIPRGATFFNTASELYALDTGKEYTVVGNLGFATSTNTESVNSMRYNQMYTIADISSSSSSSYKSLLTLSSLSVSSDSITVSASDDGTLKLPDDFTVTADISSVSGIDVTEYVTVTGYSGSCSSETVTLSFTYNGVTLTKDITVTTTDGTHNYESTVTTEPTCTETGVLTYTCTLCGDTYTETIDALGHSLVKVEAVEATETEDGNIEYYVCSVCGELFLDEEGTTSTTIEEVTIAATGTTNSSDDDTNGQETTVEEDDDATDSSDSNGTTESSDTTTETSDYRALELYSMISLLAIEGAAYIYKTKIKED